MKKLFVVTSVLCFALISSWVNASCTVVVPMSNKQAAVYTYPDKLCKLLGIPLD